MKRRSRRRGKRKKTGKRGREKDGRIARKAVRDESKKPTRRRSVRKENAVF